MIVQPVDHTLVVCFALAMLSTAYFAYDQIPNNPEPTVMRWGFILVTFYMGPFGLLLTSRPTRTPARLTCARRICSCGSRASAVAPSAGGLCCPSLPRDEQPGSPIWSCALGWARPHQCNPGRWRPHRHRARAPVSLIANALRLRTASIA